MDNREYNDIYDKDRNLTGRVHLRGRRWKRGEYGLVSCVWVHDGRGNILLTRRAPEKSAAGTWENSGGAVKAGETSLQGVVRELFEETGIRAKPEDFELLGSQMDGNAHFDHYCLKADVPLEEIVLLPGETDGVQWVDFETVHSMVKSKAIHPVIGKQFLKYEQQLLERQDAR